VEVNLGMYAQGFGLEANQPEETEPVKETPKVEEHKIENNDVVEEDIVSEDEETPSIEQPQEEVEELIEEAENEEEIVEEIIEEKQEEIVPEEKPIVNRRALFQVPKNDNAVPTSEGDDKGDGEKGIANGLKDIERYEGNGGSGNGPSYDLGGRGAKSIAAPSKEFNEEGALLPRLRMAAGERVPPPVIALLGQATRQHEAVARDVMIVRSHDAPFVCVVLPMVPQRDDGYALMRQGGATSSGFVPAPRACHNR
jgi:hypothetical protein